MSDDICPFCKDNFIVNSRSITCDLCKYKCHSHCARIKDDICKSLIKIENLKWLCDKCLKSFGEGGNQVPSYKIELECAQRENELIRKFIRDQEYTISLQKEIINNLRKKNQEVSEEKTGI